MVDELCSYCEAISLDKMRGPNLDRMQDHQSSYLALKRSAESGCQLCAFFWHALGQDFSPAIAEEKQGVLAAINEKYPGRQLSLTAWGGGTYDTLDRIHILTTGEPPSPTDSEYDKGIFDRTLPPEHQTALDGTLDLYAEPDDPASTHGGVTGRPLPTAVGGDAEFDLIHHWLKECCENHEQCSHAANQKLPKRVLDLQAFGNQASVRLVEPVDNQKVPYATLSHCWGGMVALTTTGKNLAAHLRSIDMHSMPKTFREAVKISRKLGIRYLWIDSLCILQGSKADWEDQAPKMSEIYANGFVNIAARGAVNSTMGCFISRPEPPTVCRLQYQSEDGKAHGTMYVRDPSFQYESIRHSPLDQRAWVYQERLLSPRIVYFGSQQLYWECATTALRQDGRFSDVSSDGMRSWNFKSALDMNAIQNSELGRHAKYWQWHRIVEEYTRRHLTYQSDTLAAIAGLANAFKAKHSGRYIAGIWREDLVNGLCWTSRSLSSSHPQLAAKMHRHKIEGSQLPSWTWASRYGPVDYGSASPPHPREWTHVACEVADLTPTTTGMFGEIENAVLTLRAQIAQATYDPCRRLDLNNTANLHLSDGRPVGRLYADDEEVSKDKQQLSCVVLKDGWNDSVALAVKRVDKRPGCYQRLGLVKLPLRHPTKDIPVFSQWDVRTIKLV